MSKKVNYNSIAATYDNRYKANNLSDVSDTLKAVTKKVNADRVLEVGCGTGKWLADLRPFVKELYGVDPSMGMLGKARERDETFNLLCTRDTEMQFNDSFFDLIFCVNAIHHFNEPSSFVKKAFQMLRPGGTFCIIGWDPTTPEDYWYIYDYFYGIRETDLERFPTWSDVKSWMENANFSDITLNKIKVISDKHEGKDVLDSPFIKKDSCSQFALLTDEEYANGMESIRKAILKAEANNTVLEFKTRITTAILSGIK